MAENETDLIEEGQNNLSDNRSVDLNIGRDVELEQGDLIVGDKADRDKITAGGDVTTNTVEGVQNNTNNTVARDQVIYNYYGGVPKEDEEEPTPGDPPYKGQQNYTFQDSEMYVGREELITHCLSHLHNNSLLAITGQSRIGKSSFIRGGVVPALSADKAKIKGALAPAGSSRWPIYIMTPSINPLESLGASLTSQSESVRTAFTVADDMLADNRSFAIMARQLANEAGADRILLVIDEFEELFTICKNEEVRLAFIDNLMTAVNAAGNQGSVSVILSIKSMYLRDELLRYEDLWGVIERNKVELPPISQAALRRIIEEPAADGEWEFEAGLVDYLLREVGNEPGRLDLISRALHSTWQRRRGRTMTFVGYGEVGNIHLTLVDRAELVFTQGLNTPEQEFAQNLFMRLTELGEGTQDGRRTVSMSQVSESSEEEQMGDEVKNVLQKLADAGLLIIREHEIDLSHDSLVRRWPRLRTWIEEGREQLRLQRQLTRDAEQWLASNRHPDSLYRGARLGRTQDIISDTHLVLNPLEAEFLIQSQAAVDKAEAEKEAIRQKQLDDAEQIATLEKQRAAEQEKRAEEQEVAAKKANRAARILRWAAAISICLTIVALYATYTARVSQIELSDKSRVIRARELATYAMDNIDLFPQRAMLLAIEAMSVYTDYEVPDPELVETYPLVPDAVEAFRRSLSQIGGAPVPPIPGVYEENSAVNSVTISPDNRWLAAGLENGNVILWDSENTTQRAQIISNNSPYNDQSVFDLQFSPDNRYLYVSNRGNAIVRWELSNLNNDPIVITDGAPSINQISIDATDQWLVAGGDDGRVLVWSTSDLTTVSAILTDHTDQVYAVEISPDDQWIVTGSEDTDLYVYATNDLTQEPIKLDSHNEPVFDIDFAPSGNQMITAGGTPPWIALDSADAIAYVWDFSSGPNDSMVPVHQLTDHSAHIINAEYSPDGQWLVTASYDETMNLYETDNLTLNPLKLHGHEAPLTDIVFSRDSQTIFTSSEDMSIRQWYMSARFGGLVASPIVLPEPDTIITTVALDDSNTWMSVGTKNGSVYLYNQERVFTPGQVGVQQLEGHEQAVHALTFSPPTAEQQWLATGGDDGLVKLWALGNNVASATPTVLNVHTEAVMELAFSPDGRWLVSGGHEGAVYAWDLANLSATPIALGAWEQGFIHTLAFTPFDEDTPPEDPIWLVATSGPAPEVFDRSAQNKVILWKYDPIEGWIGDPLKLDGHTDSIVAIDISESGQLLATGSADHTLRIWNLHDLNAPVTIITDYPDGIRHVKFTDDGELLAVAGWSEDIYIWDTVDVARPRPPYILKGHTQWITSIDIDPEGAWLASSSHDGSVRLWDLDALFDLNATERELELDEINVIRAQRLSQSTNLTQSIVLSSGEGHAGNVRFSTDNQWLISTNSNYVTNMWHLDLPSLMEAACRSAGRALLDNSTEWEQYFPDEVYAPRCTPGTIFESTEDEEIAANEE